MWVQVRTFDGKKATRIDGLSKLTKVEEFRQKLVEHFDASPDRQRLFYRGKQLEDGHTLFDYNVGLNEIIQIMIRPADLSQKQKTEKKIDENENRESSSDNESVASDKENQKPKETPKRENDASTVEESTVDRQADVMDDIKSTYRIGDIVDIRDPMMGAWFEGKIVKVSRKPADYELNNQMEDSEISENERTEVGNKQGDRENNRTCKDSEAESESSTPDDADLPPIKDELEDDGCLYHVLFEGYEEDDKLKVPVKNVRPRCRHKIPLKDLKIGEKVMVNFNYDDPDTRGYWYDAIVTSKRDTRTIKILTCTVYFGCDLAPMQGCNIWHYDEVFRIEKVGTQMNINDPEGSMGTPVKRQNKPECDHCKDNPKKKCKHCACHQCGGKEDPEKTIMCDECDNAYHLACLNPPLEEVPDVDEWYCPLCKNDENEVVRAGEKLKESKKKSKMASATTTSSRDWGRGMACAGRTKECRIVPPNHFGSIPGIEVGSQWKFRVQASESGCHRPHVAGIHGREEDGAYSIVLSGGYEDDVDNGDEFTYTGSGGRDLSGNKRTAEQSCDQTLTRMNKALAKNCNAPLDAKKGAEAKDWRGGKPVRVIRNCKGRKHSKYAPEEGNRYDGLYKIVKYWPESGKSGFLVWRYLLRRDDEIPAPWTKEGKKRMNELGLTMQYPEGYLETQEEKEKESTPGRKKKGKRKRNAESSDEESESSAKKKFAPYKLKAELSKLIKQDTLNEKLWDEALQHRKEGGQKFLAKVEELFMCICCQDVVFKPITLTCAHNICKPCLTRSFQAEVYSCPACRQDLGKDYKMTVNKTLTSIMNSLFPGYENGR